MKKNPHVQDEIYRAVGEEVVRKEYHPGPMARAVAESAGNRDVVQSLYIRFRCEELERQVERAEQQARERKRQNIFDCPCGFSGKAKIKERGSILLTLVLLCLFVVPGLIYALDCSGYKAVCPNCGRLLADRVKP